MVGGSSPYAERKKNQNININLRTQKKKKNCICITRILYLCIVLTVSKYKYNIYTHINLNSITLFFPSSFFDPRQFVFFIFRFINAYHRRAKRIKLGIWPRRRVIRPEMWSSGGSFGRYMYMVRNTRDVPFKGLTIRN